MSGASRGNGVGPGPGSGSGPEGRTSFGDRLAAAMDTHGPLCVGIDPHPGLLASWGLSDDAGGLRRFALTVVEALAGRVAALKPQSAFFERHGAAGVRVLEEVLAAARAAGGGTQVIVDAKRGDIGSTMAGYADAFLSEGSPLAGDALTVSPYLGLGSLGPAVDRARAGGRGLFVLALTSNPEGASVQHARLGDESVAAGIARGVGELNAAELGTERTADPDAPGADVSGTDAPGADRPCRMGSVGLVVGATVGGAVADLGIDLAAVRGPLLAPGVGAQGAGRDELARVFGAARSLVLPSTSRAVLSAGPDIDGLRGAALAALRVTTEALADSRCRAPRTLARFDPTTTA